MTGPLVPIIMWQGSGSFPAGKTPFGIFDDDDRFNEDAPRVAKWICSTLGYPIMAVELTDVMVYGQFEQAIVEFSSQVNEFNMREQMMAIQGAPTGSNLTGKLINPSPLPNVIQMSQMYGTEANAGGNVSQYKGNVTLQDGVQNYDLNTLWSNVSESGNRIEMRRIWHGRIPALQRFFDPFSGGGGLGTQEFLGQFGFGNYSVASQYVLMPVYETLLRAQAIEFNDLIRRSQYSFELVNNQLRIFPIPSVDDQGTLLWFEYMVERDKFIANTAGTTGVTSDFANAPYQSLPYQFINDVGRRWIWKYTLGLCKIVLGNVRSKYSRIPIPDSEQQLDGDTLRREGADEIRTLMTELRDTLEQTGRKAQLQKMAENEANASQILNRVPLPFYIG